MKKTRGVPDRVAETISRFSMFAPADPVGVAVSGGADSVFLLHVLRELAPEQPLLVLHLNHGLRGAESDADAAFAKEQARALDLPFELRRADVAQAGGNLEQAGRRARLAFFRDVLGRGVVARVATGHTLDDQAETVLYRLFRGAGTQGLRGILPVTREGLVRPLLEIRRSEIEAWLKDRGLEWREDATNRDTRYVRNRIRHSLIPVLEREYNPEVRESLARLAVLAADEEAYWQAEVARVAPGVIARERDAVLIGVEALGHLPRALARRLVRQALVEVRGDSRRLDAAHVDDVLALGSTAGRGRVVVPGAEAVKWQDKIRVVAARRKSGNALIALQVIERYNEVGGIDADSVPEGAVLRVWRPGDRLEVSPGRTVKLKELFQQARIPSWERESWPVFACGSEVVWTRRFGVGAPYAAGRQTRRFLEVVEGTPGA